MSWLWKNDTSSPASFEKALSKLSSQINAANVSLEKTRSRGRRTKALWTLYTTLTYLISLLILVLVIGPADWALPHYAGLLGGPALIYSVRLGITTAFGWRTNRQEAHLKTLQKHREEKITALKKATKYDSTQELLQKYGGAPPTQEKPKESPQTTKKQIPQQQRTGLPPPPTANIQRRPTQPITPQRPEPQSPTVHLSPASPIVPDEPGFAPNAFTLPTKNVESASHWYDRILDVLLGEDEASAKNRLVLLCQNCRVVNGQAPPGIKTLEELGRWRCINCGAWNGHENEATKVVKEMKENKTSDDAWEKVSHVVDDVKVEESDLVEDRGDSTGAQYKGESPSMRVTRSSGKQPVEGL